MAGMARGSTTILAFENKWMQPAFTHRVHPLRDRSVDMMIAAHIVNPLGSGALKPLAPSTSTGAQQAGQAILDAGMAANGWDWATVPVTDEPYWAYAALDTVLTARLWDRFKRQVGPEARTPMSSTWRWPCASSSRAWRSTAQRSMSSTPSVSPLG